MKKLFTLICLTLGLFKVEAQYTQTSIITGLDYPVCLAIAPDDRYFISLKGGSGASAPANATLMTYNADGTVQGTLWDFTDSVEVYFERGVLGVAVDPDFTTNHFVYVFYNHYISSDRIRVMRFTETNGVGSNPTIVFDIADPHSAGNHTGGNIHFGPDGKLYISIGDRATQSNSQDITNNPFGKILRLNSDGTIPTNNPFYDDGNPAVGNDDRIWSYGHRNAFDFTFSTVNDSLYSSENGLNTWDEVNMIHKGGNYGWPTCEGFFNQGSTTTPCSNASSVLPLDDWNAPLPAVTGIVVYDHTLMPEFTNHLLVVDYEGVDITDFTLGNAPAYDVVSARSTVAITLSGLTDIEVGNEGCLYVIEGGYTPNGKLKRICPTGMSIGENDNIQFTVFPNPSTGSFTLQISNDLVNGNMTVSDISGRAIHTQILNSLTSTVQLEKISKGIYLVEITKNGKTVTQKIIVE